MKRTGIVYEIIPNNGDPQTYIGSTFNTRKQRMGLHRSAYRAFNNGTTKDYCSVYVLFDKYGVEGVNIVELESFPDITKPELERYEGYYQDTRPMKVNLKRAGKPTQAQVLECGRRYEQSDKGKSVRRAYRHSEAGKLVRRAYRHSEAGKSSQHAYNHSEAGKLARHAYNHSEAGKSSMRKYLKSEKGKQTVKRGRDRRKRKAEQQALDNAVISEPLLKPSELSNNSNQTPYISSMNEVD
jgi:hypothetical protein